MKKKLVYFALGVVSFIANFLIYNVSFNVQATPFLHEEQRVESAILMMKTTLPAFFVVAVVFCLVFYFVSEKFSK